MKGLLVIICLIVIAVYGYFQISKLTEFLKANRRGRKNYDYSYTDDDD